MPVCMTFIDFEKAFDSLKAEAVMEAVEKLDIEWQYQRLIRYIYETATATITVNGEKDTIQLKRGIRQGDALSPKLFTAALQDKIRNIDWSNGGLDICGEKLTHLMYADDIVLFAEDMETLQGMVNKVYAACLEIGLRINRSKTKSMCNGYILNRKNIYLENEKIELVERFVYSGQVIELNNKVAPEITKRIQTAWAAFSKLSYILKDVNTPINLRRKVLNQCINPVTTYASETWTLTKGLEERLATTQRKMERLMLGITLRDKWTMERIRGATGVSDVVEAAKRSKWRWAGHVARCGMERWIARLTSWRPRRNREVGRPRRRWEDELVWFEMDWRDLAQNRDVWKMNGEAFIQEWIENG